MTAQEATNADLAIRAGQVFTPASPINARELFAGRKSQVRRVVDAVNQRGQHAILYGERGVGKTSLINVLHSFLQPQGVFASRVGCVSGDTFKSVWLKVVDTIKIIETTSTAGFFPQTSTGLVSAVIMIEGEPTPDSIRKFLATISTKVIPIIMIDEFDALSQDDKRLFADTIKSLSDNSVAATLVLVGVADSVEKLIENHQSIERAVVQIQMPRMSTPEIQQIVRNGLGKLGMTIDADALSRISGISNGLPHYTHLLSLHATRAALDSGKNTISTVSVDAAVDQSISSVQQTIKGAYEKATRSSRPNNLFSDVLLASALAKTSELGFFAALDVRAPLHKIAGKKYEITSFAKHLNEFCDTKRGNIIVKTGERRLYRYRFANPLMQPYVVMNGLKSGRIKSDIFEASGA